MDGVKVFARGLVYLLNRVNGLVQPLDTMVVFILDFKPKPEPYPLQDVTPVFLGGSGDTWGLE